MVATERLTPEPIHDPLIQRFNAIPVLQSENRLEQKNAIKAVEEAVRFATEERDDHQATLMVLRKSTELLRDGQPLLAKTMVQKLDDYYRDMGTSYKYMFPFDEEKEIRGANAYDKAFLTSVQLPETYGLDQILPKNINVLGVRISNTLREMTRVYAVGQSQNDVLVFSYDDPTYQRQHAEREELRLQMWEKTGKFHDDVFQKLGQGLDDEFEITENVPETVFRIGQTIAKGPPFIRRAFDFLSKKTKKGISWNDVAQEKDPVRHTHRLFEYAANLPRGDVFWQRLLYGALLPFPPKQVNIGNPEATFANPELSKRLYGFQWYVTQKLLLPAFDDSFTDSRFDKVLSPFTDSLSETGHVLLGRLMEINGTADEVIRHIRDPRFTLGHPNTHSLFLDMAIASSTSPFASDRGASGQVLDEFFIKHKQQITESLHARFPNNEAIEKIMKQFWAGFETGKYIDWVFQAYTELLETIPGEPLGLVLNDIEERFNTEWLSIQENMSMFDDVNEDTGKEVTTVAFPPAIPVERLGIEGVFLTQKKESEDVQILIRFARPDLSLLALGSNGTEVAFTFGDGEGLIPQTINRICYAAYSKYLQEKRFPLEEETSIEKLEEVVRQARLDDLKVTTDSSPNDTSTGDNVQIAKSEKTVETVDPDQVLLKLQELLRTEEEDDYK